jgi:SET domain-containing protein
MLLIDTTVGPSKIHGLGCFANEFIPEGKRIWVFDRRIDPIVYKAHLSKLPEAIQSFLHDKGFVALRRWRKCIVLCGDNSRYMNHSDDPNVVKNVACRDIEAGDELTCDYWSFDLDAAKKCGTVRPTRST